MKEKSNLDKWLRFLDPENLKDNLIFSSLYIASFESFKDYVIDEVKFFYCHGIRDNDFVIDKQYNQSVKSKDKNLMMASLLWLHEQSAIDEKDIEMFDQLRQYRNKLSHELMNLLFDGLPDELPQKFIDLIALRIKIEKWWVLNIEIPTDPEFDAGMEIKEENITTSSQILYQLIMDIVYGDEKKATYYRDEFLKTFRS